MKVARDSTAAWRPKPGGVERRLARAWREQTGGTGRDRELERRTLIACSGGGDSAGLVLALAAAVSRAREVFVVGHVVHDLRSREESVADRDSARDLAERLGLPFAEAEVQARGKGNAEAAARRLRYRALARMAREAGCGYVATAHHAEDQLETMLMAMVRGAGPIGMAGIASRRRIGTGAGEAGKREGAMLIRPALGVGREELREVCKSAGWSWREDATNADESRLRAAIRARVVPELERIRPGAAKRAARGSVLMKGAADEVRRAARMRIPQGGAGEFTWKRADLRTCSEVVVGEVIRVAGVSLLGGHGADRFSAAGVRRSVQAVLDRGTDPRAFRIGPIVVEVTARRVVIRKASDGGCQQRSGGCDE